ncbi:MAG: Eco57I restriction-modification methylase [Methanocella sp. PtaU1.Bin125]|nr:MAG: Eco57I restriction-modification methylase [Methanocella sp. PtaU1.Bin125]
MTARNSLTGRYDLLVDALARQRFAGDLNAARACADDAMATVALGMAGASGPIPGQVPEGLMRHVEEFLADVDDVAGAVNETRNVSAARIRQTAARDAGAVYTPLPVARYMCRQAIGSYLSWHLSYHQDGEPGSIDDLIARGDKSELRKARDLLRDMRFADTSCGTGIFLEAALEEICRLQLAVSGRLDQRPRQLFELATETLAKNIYGMDIEAYSVESARVRLLLRLMSYNRPRDAAIDRIKMNLTQANVLLPEDERPMAGGFDVIAGNPPYMRVKSMFREAGPGDRKPMKDRFARAVKESGLYRCQEGNLNLYKLFIERNLALLRDDGSMCLIFPSSFLNETTSTRLRQQLFSGCDVEEIVEIPERSKLFHGINQATCILTCRKGAPTRCLRIRHGADMDNLDGNGTIRVDAGELSRMTSGRMEVPLFTSPDLEWAMLSALRRIPPFSGNAFYPPIGEISVGNVDETIDRAFISDMPTGDLFVKGIHLNEYAVDLRPDGPRPRWVRKNEFLEKRPAAARAIASPRIIGRNTRNKASPRRLKFAILPEGYLCGNSVKQIVVTDRDIDPLYLIALLNSSVLNWHFEIFCSQNNIRNYSIEALPVPRATRHVQEAFAFVARLIMDASGEEREFLDKRFMDAMAYELYFMDMRMLSSAVLSSMEEGVTAETLNRQDDIRAIIDSIAAREGFKVTQRTTYRL